jgi:hypothetical protein
VSLFSKMTGYLTETSIIVLSQFLKPVKPHSHSDLLKDHKRLVGKMNFCNDKK